MLIIKIKAVYVYILCLWLSAAIFSQAFAANIPVSDFAVPAAPGNYINDYAHLLSKGVINNLNQTLSNEEKNTSNQIVAAIFPGKLNQSIEDFSIKLQKKWKIGQKQKDNGILLVIFPQERQIRIEVGYGLEGALPDSLANQIIQQEIAPAFQQKNYDQGIVNGINAVQQAIKGEYAAKKKSPDNSGSFYIPAIILAFLALKFTIGRRKNGYGFNKRYGGGDDGFGGGGGSSGGGGASGRW